MRMNFLILLGVVLLVHAYVLWHVYQVLPAAKWLKWTVVALMLAMPLMMLGGFSGLWDKLPLPLASASYELATSWLIVFLYLIIAFVIVDAGRLAHLIPKALVYNSWWTTGVVAGAVAALLIGGNIHYRNKVREEVDVTTAKALDRPVKVVMVSDLHLGYHNRKAEWRRWVEMLNAEEPDLIVVAGDIIDGYMRPLREQDMAADFHDLKAPVVACLGNHEYFTGLEESIDFYRRAGITLLRDSVASVKGINIIGRDDRSNPRRKSLRELARNVNPHHFTLVLDHQPYLLEEARQAGVDFQFSGHTHEGQVWPISLIVDRMYENAWGYCQKGKTHYYVSSGLGIWGGKFRIGTQSEYVVLTITHE